MNKEKLLENLRNHIDFVCGKIDEKLEKVKKMANMTIAEIRKLPESDRIVYMNSKGIAQKRMGELTHLSGSPYFTKCEIVDENGKEKSYYFAKHEFSEQNIYSWVAPIATIRFEDPGSVSYKIPNGEIKTLTVKEKDQYLIVEKNVVFFSRESRDKPRDLIYQEHFTKQKSEFALPEIVAQIEKAQDQVIRANHKGPLVISGPAGSGKTTLALHRVAYLTQAPDTAEFYPTRSIIVFVQDSGTKEYFSKLLPGLGIYDVNITTFSEWVFLVLNIRDYRYMERFGENEEEKDFYEYQKLQSIREQPIVSWNASIFEILLSKYKSNFSLKNFSLFEKQKKEKILDRFDLTILLQSYFGKYKKFEIKKDYQTYVKDKLVKKTRKTPVEYSLIIVDEFQNYLPEQLQIFKKCLKQDTNSVIYVGDMAQQVKLGTIRNWEEIREVVLPERNIKLNKVYRNTQNILSYIQSLGYSIELPQGLKQGPPVFEKNTENQIEEINYIKETIPKYKNGSICIISKNEKYLEIFKREFFNIKNIHVLSMLESQGVEFDLVFLVGIDRYFFEIANNIGILPKHLAERERMQKDLLYVALTRAITELHVLGKDTLSNIARDFI